MIDFSTLRGLTIPEGKVIKITDYESGNILWELINDVVSLEVKKITDNTYANETTYSGEEFILLDIYPETNGTVLVTYGGLTKTITDTSGAEEPEAQKVYFGTFNGVSDSVATPTSGTLTIEGDYRAFGNASYNQAKAITSRCECIVTVNSYGKIKFIPNNALQGCTLTSTTIPNSVTSIGNYAFSGCKSLTSIIIPNSVTSIGNGAFSGCKSLTSIIIPNSVTSIGDSAFSNCTGLANVIIGNNIASFSEGMFNACVNLTSLPKGNRIAVIDTYAFRDCTGLTSIIIPRNITRIRAKAFSGCTNLSRVTFEKTSGWMSSDTGNIIDVTSPGYMAQFLRSSDGDGYVVDLYRS